MSHLVTIKCELRDPAAIRAACARLKLPAPEQGTHDVFSKDVTGLAVKLPDWQYPVVIDTATGQAHYDNFNGRWGEQRHLDAFKQAYAVERAKLEARKHGYTVREQSLSDGSVRLTINQGA
jgi:hypothetical protein